MSVTDPRRDVREAAATADRAEARLRDLIRGLAAQGIPKTVLARWAGRHRNTVNRWCRN